ncbi:hypothetical protein MtrunA17_Chr4g0037341 [Medicago truncatula]|uniref:Uncharacterized protein n=1 Tax=Medicago truncatula TaxID=3880 RepID=A0A396I7C1_MEDTR|nr:hypothetical protein MtrunA17_Chr4g0037341 [Medicago truncatula]
MNRCRIRRSCNRFEPRTGQTNRLELEKCEWFLVEARNRCFQVLGYQHLLEYLAILCSHICSQM